MHEVTTSRRDAMRSFAILPAILAAPSVASAAITATQHPDWLALLAEERRTSADFGHIGDVQDDAYGRFYDARAAAMEAWQADWDKKIGRPHLFIDARPGTEEWEERSSAGIRDYNAYHERMVAQREAIETNARRASGLIEIDKRYDALCDAHTAAIKAIVAYPSRDPDIIEFKLRMIINRYGDDNGEIAPLLASIAGEAVA